MKKDYVISVVISGSLHGIIFLIMFINLHILLFKTYGKYSTKTSIQTYLYSTPAIKKFINEELKFPSLTKKNSEVVNFFSAKSTANKNSIKINGSEKSSATTGENYEKLLQILHDKISANQQYPQSALLLKQKGIVRIAFRLFPDGHLENLRIVQSSNIKSFDEGAIAAVNGIMPVAIAGVYLKNPKEFYINLIYE